MKPISMIIDPGINSSFRVAYHVNSDLLRDSGEHVPLHYHKEYEIMVFLNAQGSRIIGSNVAGFSSGEVYMMGKNLSHEWLGEPNSGRKDWMSEYLYICFDDNVFGESFFRLPEMQNISFLLKRSNAGLLFKGKTAIKIIRILKKIMLAKESERVILLLKCLSEMADSTEFDILNNHSVTSGIDIESTDKINKAMQYILDNYSKDISVEDIADHIAISPNAFSRFFKSKTFKNFSEYLNEVRISKASSMLFDDTKRISDVAYSCGFNNLSNFNRQFKRFMQVSPIEYKKMLINKKA